MGVVLYKKYLATVLSNTKVSINSITTSYILNTVETFSGQISLETYETLECSSSDLLRFDQLFLCPIPPSDNVIVDGAAYGNITVGRLKSDSNLSYYISKIYVYIVTVDSAGNETVIGGGDDNIMTSSLSMTGFDAVKETYPFWISIDDQRLSHAENVGIRVKVYGHGDVYDGYLTVYYDSDNDELFFELPLAVTGD